MPILFISGEDRVPKRILNNLIKSGIVLWTFYLGTIYQVLMYFTEVGTRDYNIKY